VRINVQLIDASNDRHLWAQVYDRELTDMFAVQSELAREIAGALRATLAPAEQERLDRKPTQNGDAYLLYQEAHEIFSRPDRHHDSALGEFAVARGGLPNDPGIFRAMAAIQRRQGKWQESSASYAKAVSLDPKDPILLENMGMNYLATRDYATCCLATSTPRS